MESQINEVEEVVCPYFECDGSGYIEIAYAPDDTRLEKCRCLKERLAEQRTIQAIDAALEK